MSLKMLVKRLLYPGTNLGVRSRKGIVRHFLAEPNIRTLDVGSGNGYFAARAGRRAGAGSSVLSVSFDADQVGRCNAFKPYMPCPPDRLEFRVMNAQQMDALTEQFDQILFLEVIEHIDNDREVLAKLAQRLKPGGIIHITTPDCRLGPWTGHLDRMARGGHVRLGYSSERLARVVREVGLDVSFQTRLGGPGMYLTPLHNGIARLLGGSQAADVVGFLCSYPIYFLVEWIPIPQSCRMIQYIIARRPLNG